MLIKVDGEEGVSKARLITSLTLLGVLLVSTVAFKLAVLVFLCYRIRHRRKLRREVESKPLTE
jgi:hypothetical protein